MTQKQFKRAGTSLIAVMSITGLLLAGCGTGAGTAAGQNKAGATAATNTNSANGTGGNSSSNGSNTGQGSSGSGSSGSGNSGSNKSGSSAGTGSGSTNTSASNSTAGSSGGGSSSSGSGSSGQAGAYAGWPTAGSWLQVSVKTVAQLPVGILGNALAMNANGQPVSVGGYTGRVSITNVNQLLPHVSTIANLPVRTHDAAVGYAGNTLYVFGGGQAVSYNTVVAIQGGTAKTVTTLSRPLSDAASVPLTVGGEKGLALVGGYDGSVFRPDVAFMSVTASGSRTWKKLFNLPTPVRYGAVASTTDTLYIAGGLGEHGLSNHVYAWSASSQKLQTVATLPHALQKAALYVAGPYLIVIGGEPASGQPTAEIIEIDTRTGKSKVVGKFPTSIADMGYTQSKNVGYLAGGITTSSDSSAAKSVYEITWQK